jgi:hypothetical protein
MEKLKFLVLLLIVLWDIVLVESGSNGTLGAKLETAHIPRTNVAIIFNMSVMCPKIVF